MKASTRKTALMPAASPAISNTASVPSRALDAATGAAVQQAPELGTKRLPYAQSLGLARQMIAARLQRSPTQTPIEPLGSITPDMYSTRLRHLLKSPELIQQGILDACGFAAISYAYLKKQPHLFIQYALDLYLKGHATFGTETVKFSHKKAVVEEARTNAPEIVDWILLLALINAFLSKSYVAVNRETGLLTRISAAMLSSSLTRILRSIGFRIEERHYLKVAASVYPNNTDKALLGSALIKATQRLQSGQLGVALVSPKFLEAAQNATNMNYSDSVFFDIPNHWIVISKPVTETTDEKGEKRYRLTYVTWGHEMSLTFSAGQLAAIFQSLWVIGY